MMKKKKVCKGSQEQKEQCYVLPKKTHQQGDVSKPSNGNA